MCHARLTCTRIYDTRTQSVHWREAKMRMRIPSLVVEHIESVGVEHIFM